MISTTRITITGTLLIALSGCAGDYQQAATAFHQAAADNTQVISDQNDLVMRLGLEVRRDLAIEVPPRLTTADGQCTADTTTGCEILFRLEQSSPPEALQPATQPLENTLALARAIEGYGASLQAIADADTATEVNTAVVDAASAIGSLASTASTVTGRPEAPSELAYAQPIGAALGWVLGLYVKKAQLDALRAATAAAEGDDPSTGPMAEATGAFDMALAKVEEVMRPVLADAVIKRQAAFVNGSSAKTFDAYILAAGTLDQLVKSNASEIPQNLREAHRELHAALRANDVKNLEEFFSLIEKVQNEVAALQVIINNLLALSDQPEEATS